MASLFKLFFLLTFLTHFTYGIFERKENSVSIFSRLIHRDSIKSPCFNNNDCSMLNYLDHPWRLQPTYIQASLHPGEYLPLFLVKFYVANQSTPQYGVMDTASHLLLIQCAPCTTCAITHSPIYNPRMSTTYKDLPCNTLTCDLVAGMCDMDSKCKYGIEYVGGSLTIGYLATEVISFETDDGGLQRVPNVVFGCSRYNTNHPDKLMTGVFGLGHHDVSLASRFGKFSYCLGSIQDPEYEFNQLALGDGAILEGDSTSLNFDEWHYYVILEGISLGGTMLDIPSSTFTFKKWFPNRPTDGVIVDTGSALTSLVEDAYNAVWDEVEETILLPTWDSLEGGAELSLEPDSLFKQYDEKWFCMTIKEISSPYSVIGLYAQQYYNVGYDLTAKEIYFQRMDCQSLEE